MSTSDPEAVLKPPADPASERLDGWKEIAAYLKREMRTVQRWEKSEGLPIHRHGHGNLATVYGYKSELDVWLKTRQPAFDDPRKEGRVGKDAGQIELEEEKSEPLPPPRPDWRVWARRVAVVLALAAVVYLLWRMIWPGPPKKVMLVVLPFENLSGDPQQDYFSDGLTDEITARLAGLEPDQLSVIARTTAMIYKGSKKNVQEIGHELRVQYVLEGTVRRANGRVRITTQLVQVSDQTHLLAEAYERDLSDILLLQSDVARTVADKIQIKLTRGRLRSPRPVNPEAYEAYLKGRFFWNKRYETRDGLERSVDYFEEAIRRDPNFALAYAGLADSYIMLGSNAVDALPPRVARPKAREAALKALHLDDSVAEAHTSLASIKLHYDWDFRGAETEFQRALELNDNYATAHQWYGNYLIVVGRPDQAIAEARRAHDLDPYSLIINVDLAWKLYMARRHDQAIEQCRKTIELEPNMFLAHYVAGMAYEQKGMYAEAISQFQRGNALSGSSPMMLLALGHAYAVSGKRDAARSTLAQLQQLSKQRYVPALYIAALYAGLGDKEQALHSLQKALDERSDQLVFLKAEPLADPVRSDPRFDAILGRVGLRP